MVSLSSDGPLTLKCADEEQVSSTRRCFDDVQRQPARSHRRTRKKRGLTVERDLGSECCFVGHSLRVGSEEKRETGGGGCCESTRSLSSFPPGSLSSAMSSSSSPAWSDEIHTSSVFPGSHPSSLLALLRNPDLLISLNPLVSSFYKLPPSSASSCSPGFVEYSVTDRIPYLFGHLATTHTYKARFTNAADGQIADVEAGYGISTTSVWRVAELEQHNLVGEDEERGCEVTETSVVSVVGWWWFGGWIKAWVERKIKTSHGLLLERLKERFEHLRREEEEDFGRRK
jgi:hypothetical protein